MRTIYNIFKKVIVLLIVLMIIYSTVIIAPNFVGYQPYAIKSATMEPAISTGSLEFINKNNKNAQVDTIVNYVNNDNNIVIARVKEINDGVYTVQADRSTISEKIEANKIIGTYLCHIPFIGFIVAMMTPKNIILSGVYFILFVIFTVLFGKFTAYTEKDAVRNEDNWDEDMKEDDDDED